MKILPAIFLILQNGMFPKDLIHKSIFSVVDEVKLFAYLYAYSKKCICKYCLFNLLF